MFVSNDRADEVIPNITALLSNILLFFIKSIVITALLHLWKEITHQNTSTPSLERRGSTCPQDMGGSRPGGRGLYKL